MSVFGNIASWLKNPFSCFKVAAFVEPWKIYQRKLLSLLVFGCLVAFESGGRSKCRHLSRQEYESKLCGILAINTEIFSFLFEILYTIKRHSPETTNMQDCKRIVQNLLDSIGSSGAPRWGFYGLKPHPGLNCIITKVGSFKKQGFLVFN